MKSLLSSESLLEGLGQRYATKDFDTSKKISVSDWAALLESLRLSPSSYGLQPWKFFVVKNPAIRKKLRAASWDQSKVDEASHFVVFTTLKQVDAAFVRKYIKKTAELRNISVESLKGFEDMLLDRIVNNPSVNHLAWTQKQAYIAMGFLGLAASLL